MRNTEGNGLGGGRFSLVRVRVRGILNLRKLVDLYSEL